MQTQSQARTCPVCAASADLFGVKSGFSLARCPSCCTIFVLDPPVDTSEVYGEGYFTGGNDHGGYMDYDAEKDATRSTFVRSLDRIEEACHSKGRMLDVGAASGYFLDIARERGWQVEGIDIAPSARAEALKKGIEVRTGVLEAGVYPTNSFEAVTAFDVVEHVPNPKALLTAMQNILKPGGVLFGSTPDAASNFARLMGKRWHLLCPPEHLTVFSDQSLRRALAETGFEVLWTGRIGKQFTVPYIAQTAARWLNIPLLSRMATALARTPFRRLSLPLDFQDNVFFLARRV